MLGAARQELEGAGYTVRGLTFTGKAAKELQAGAGVESTTLHSFLPRIGAPEFTPSAKEAWFIDEVSMVGSKQMNDLIKASEKVNARLVFIGDTKQLQSISAGRMFQKLQETGAMKTVHMTETLRQKDEDYKQIVADIAVRRIDSAFEKMERKGKIHEITDDSERRAAIVEEFTSKKDYRNVLVVTPLNRDRNELNVQIRESLKQKGKLKGEEHTFTVREPKSLSPADKHFAASYSMGDIVTINGGVKGIKLGTQGTVLSTDRQTQKLRVLLGDNRTTEINLTTYGHKLGAYREKSIRLSEGEKVVFLKNDRTLGVQNGLTGEIKSIDPRGNITVKRDRKKDIIWNLRYTYNYLDHGYAVTDYKSQGQTSREVIFNTNTERTTSFNSFYVAATRGRDNLHVYTNDPIKLKEQVKHEALKTSTLDHGREDKSSAKTEKEPIREPTTAAKGRE
jgi:ATP-dependent exoDNAse (exonuclease V) alpha subunit